MRAYRIPRHGGVSSFFFLTVFAFTIVLAFGILLSNAQLVLAADKAPRIILHDRGSMREIYSDNAAAKLDLSELKDTEHLYGLGPLSKLRGEILILDSVPYESRIGKGFVQIKSDWNEKAAFFVWASVKKWKKVAVPSSVRSMGLLESWLSSMSGMSGAPLASQYPFLLKGNFAEIDWHIVNYKAGVTALTPRKHHETKFHGKSKNRKAEMLGFYSPEHQGFFIPQGHRTHMHVKVGDEVVAHVDDFNPNGDSGLTLYIPGR